MNPRDLHGWTNISVGPIDLTEQEIGCTANEGGDHHPMIGMESCLQEDDPMNADESNKSVMNLAEDREEEFDSMIEVESNKSSTDLSEDEEEEGSPKKAVECYESLVDSCKDNEGNPTISDELQKPMEESDPRISILLENSSFKNKLANVIDSLGSNQMSWDLASPDLPIPLAVAFEPRQSSRNAANKKPLSSQLVLPPKSSGSKRKPAFNKDLIILQVSVLMILSATSDSTLFRMTQMMKCQSCLMLGRQKSVFL